MSRIGKKPISVPSNVNVTINGQHITVKGPKGTLENDFHQDIKVKMEDNTIIVERFSDDNLHRSLHGLTRALIMNMIIGVTEGYTKELEVNGVGYRVAKQGNQIVLNVGYSHQVFVKEPDGIKFNVEGANKIIVAGIDKQLVGQIAAEIRKIREPEPYKGKGIKYADEHIRRKAGKTGAKKK